MECGKKKHAGGMDWWIWSESLDGPSLIYCLCGPLIGLCLCPHARVYVGVFLQVTDLPGLQVLTQSSWRLSCKRCPSSRLPLPPLPPACLPPLQPRPAPVSQDRPLSARNGTAARPVQGGFVSRVQFSNFSFLFFFLVFPDQ